MSEILFIISLLFLEHTTLYALLLHIGAVGVLDQSSQEYYISVTQSHDKSKAIRYKNHPLQTLYFPGFSERQKYSRMVSKKVNVYKGLRTMRHEILCNFCYLFNNLILHKPFKNKDLYDTMVDTLKHLQVHAIPYKYCYLSTLKCDHIVIFLTIYI